MYGLSQWLFSALGEAGEPKTNSAAKWVAVVGILLLGATTAGAVRASQRSQPSVPKLWLQPKPAMLMNLADVGRVEPNLF